MARRKQQKTASASANDGSSFISRERKLEILGVVMISLAFLIGLSVFTYNEADNAIVQSASFNELASPGSQVASRIQNGLGPVGAVMSYYMVYMLFGYVTLLIPAILLVYGWFVFRHFDLSLLHRHALFYSAVMLLFATIFGWLNHLYEVPSHAWSGSVGAFSAFVLLSLTAEWGSGIILVSLTLIAFLFLVDGDIQTTIERFNSAFGSLKSRFASLFQKKDKKQESDQSSTETAAADAKTQTEPETQPTGACPGKRKSSKRSRAKLFLNRMMMMKELPLKCANRIMS